MNKEKKLRKTDEQKLKLIASFVMMDDVMFEAMCDSPEFLEELLQIILQDPKLRINYESVVPQKSIRNLKGRSVRLDAYIEGKDDVFNIEIQRSNDCNHVKRVRYNASVITANNSESGDDFENIQDLCIVYITERDFFRKSRTIYHIRNTILETGDVIDDGLREIYVNTEINDGSDIAEYMELFHKKELDETDKDKFPNTFEKFNSLKNETEGVGKMCEKMEAYVKEYAKEEAIYSVIQAYSDCGFDKDKILEYIINRFNLTKEDAEEYYDYVFENV